MGETTAEAMQLPSFVEAMSFDTRPGLVVQVKVAKALVDMVGRERFTPEDFSSLVRPLTMGMTDRGGEQNVQEALVRNATWRFVAILALVVSDCDAKKAGKLLGSNPSLNGLEGFNEPELDFVESVRSMVSR